MCCWGCSHFFSQFARKPRPGCDVAHVKTLNFKIRFLSVCAYTVFSICRKNAINMLLFLSSKTAVSSLIFLVLPTKSVGISAEVIWSPLRQHLAQVGSSFLHPFWQNIWEWWRPLDRIHGLASLKVECQRSLGGQPICRSGAATYSTGWMLVIEWHVSWVSKQRQAVSIAYSDVYTTSISQHSTATDYLIVTGLINNVLTDAKWQ